MQQPCFLLLSHSRSRATALSMPQFLPPTTDWERGPGALLLATAGGFCSLSPLPSHAGTLISSLGADVYGVYQTAQQGAPGMPMECKLT